MKTILTCRECGHHENGNTESQLMNRIKIWNHVARAHPDRDIKPSQVSLVMREYSEMDLPQNQKVYHLQPAH